MSAFSQLMPVGDKDFADNRVLCGGERQATTSDEMDESKGWIFQDDTGAKNTRFALANSTPFSRSLNLVGVSEEWPVPKAVRGRSMHSSNSICKLSDVGAQHL